jgi:hypothetical protein
MLLYTHIAIQDPENTDVMPAIVPIVQIVAIPKAITAGRHVNHFNDVRLIGESRL